MKDLFSRVRRTLVRSKIAKVIDQILARFSNNKISAVAAQMTYFFILSAFPFLITVLNIVSFFGGRMLTDTIHAIQSLPPELSNILLPFVEELKTSSSEGLFSIALIGGFWAASSGVVPVITAVNDSVHEGRRSRSVLETRALALVFTVFLILIFLLTAVFTVFGGQLDAWLHKVFRLPAVLDVLFSVRNLIVAAVALAVFTLLFYIAPKDHRKTGLRMRDALPGAILVCAGLFLFSNLFHFYVENFGKYSVTYGSLGGIIVLLIWIYLVSTIVLIGSECNAAIVDLRRHGWIPACDKTLLFGAFAEKRALPEENHCGN